MSISIVWRNIITTQPLINFFTNIFSMKHHKPSKTQQAVIMPAPTEAGAHQTEVAFFLSPDEVARKAYFSYENEGSLPGHEVQHWLKAEADLIAERNLTRVHGFHNRT